MGSDQSSEEATGRRRVTVAEASEALGITVEAVRGRIKRGTLEHERDSGTVYVLLPADQAPTGRQPDADQTTDQSEATAAPERDALADELRDRVRYLEGQVEEEREARRRADTLLAQLMQRIPELEAPREAPRVPQSEAVSEEPPEWPEQPRSGVDVPSGARGSPETVAGGPGEAWWGSPAEEAPEPRESPPSSGPMEPSDTPPEASGAAHASRESRQAEEEHDPNLRAGQETTTPPERRSLWRWIFGGGS